MKLHTVAQGECLLSIAHANGFFIETLWNHAGNADLRKKRGDPNCLFPGDSVFIPDKRRKEESCSTGRLHVFRLVGVPAKVAIEVLYCGKPRTGERYTITIDGASESGEVGRDGVVRFHVPPNAKKGSLVVGAGLLRTEYTLQLGHLDPVNEIAGVQGRLKNLGHYHGPIDGALNQDTKVALMLFQHDLGLECSGELDAATLQALRQNHERL
ncbi:MAG: peptidoglycan-binding protein [Bryobacterales bacterium]|nr:peptidoglycan-binding protein [Bryobacterales bacterium]